VFRVDADVVAELIEKTILSRVKVVELGLEDVRSAVRDAKCRAVRGGAIDWLFACSFSRNRLDSGCGGTIAPVPE